MKLTKFIIPFLFLIILISCNKYDEKISASGVFEATEIIISSQSSGEILQFNITEGQQVSKGQLLGLIDSVQLDLKKDQLLKSIDIAQSRRPDINVQMAPVLQQLISAEKEKRRVENLLKAGATNEKSYDDINAQILLIEKQLTAQRSSLESNNLLISREIESLGIQLKQIEDQIERCRVTSPISGTILLKYAEMGELAGPGKALIKIADISEMYLRAYITSSQLTAMKLGQSVEVVTDFGEKENRSYPGIIKWISDKAEFTPKTIQTRDERSNLVYAVRIAVPNDGFLKIGMYGGIKSEND